MKTLTLIVLFICLPAMAQSAMNTRQEMAAKTATAYANKAEAKVQEFFSYLELLTDPKLNPEMKTQVKQQALSLFENSTATLPDVFDSKNTTISVEALLTKAANQKQKVNFALSEIAAVSTEDVVNTWTLQYVIVISGRKLNVKQVGILKDAYKTFGTEKKKVATLYLSNAEHVK